MSDIRLSFNESFCAELEYHLSKAFPNSPDEKIKRFWCDGVSMPFVDSQLSKYNILDKQKLTIDAWIGPDGQEKYQMTIKFGAASINNIKNDQSLTDCLPDIESLDWWDIDIKSNSLEVRLL